jgi:hypothetical protein
MRHQGLNTILRSINRERGGEEPLSKKALHKITYRVQKAANEEGIELEVPYYWYMFGTVSPVSPSTVPRGGHVSKNTEERVAEITANVLQEYYSHSLEWLTDKVYEDAPYQVQREFRTLDKQIRTLHPDYSDFYGADPRDEVVLDSVYKVYDTFPGDVFPDWERSLIKWYNSITRELRKRSSDPYRLMKTNLSFWRILSLEIAQEHSDGMTRREIRGHLGIESFEKEQQAGLDRLLTIEKSYLDSKFGGTESTPVTDTAADELIAPTLSEFNIAIE